MKTLSSLKGKSILHTLYRTIVLLVLAGAALYFVGFGAIKLLMGPKDYAALSADDMKGAYTQMNVECVLDLYATTESLKSGQAKGTGTLVGAEYLVDTGDRDYLAAIYVRAKDMDALEEQFYTLNEEYIAALDDPSKEAKPLTLTGTLEPIDRDSIPYLNKSLANFELSEDTVLPYFLKVNEVNGWTPLWCWVFFAGSVLLILIALFGLIRAIGGSYQKPLRQAAENSGSPERFLDDLDHFYEEAPRFGGLRLDSRLCLFQQGAKSFLFPTESLVWAYRRTTRTNGVATSHELILCMDNGKSYGVTMKKKLVESALVYIAENLPAVELGYDGTLVKQFKAAPASLRHTAPAAMAAETEQAASGQAASGQAASGQAASGQAAPVQTASAWAEPAPLRPEPAPTDYKGPEL